MKILLINDNSAHPNWGAQATPFALIGILERSIPGVQIVSLSWDWLRRGYRELRGPVPKRVLYTPERVGILRPFFRRLSRPVAFYPSLADEFHAFADAWQAGRGGPDAEEFIRLATEADTVIYNGENSVYRNTIEGRHALFLLWFAKTRLGKPSCLVNHTANLNEVWAIMNGMVRMVAPVLDMVAARESASLRNLHELGVEQAVLFPDVVFAVDPSEISTDGFDAWRSQAGLGDAPYFCLSASGLPMSGPIDGWHGAVGDVVVALRDLGVRPVLVARDPHCQFLGEVASRTGSVYFGPEHHFTELWPLFEGAQFSVTGHFHYIVMGASVGCPFIPLSNNNHKIRGVCELLDWHRTTPFDATWLNSCRSEIVAEAERILADRQRYTRHLLDRSAALRKQARSLGDRVREIAEANLEEGHASADGDG